MTTKSLSLVIGFIALSMAINISSSLAGVETKDAVPLTSEGYTTVKWIIDRENELDVDGKKVILSGRVTQKLNGDTYIFEDETGSIKLDSDIHLPLGEKIVIKGEIDQAFLHIGSLEVNVREFYSRNEARHLR